MTYFLKIKHLFSFLTKYGGLSRREVFRAPPGYPGALCRPEDFPARQLQINTFYIEKPG
jgi:hypothetical protein